MLPLFSDRGLRYGRGAIINVASMLGVTGATSGIAAYPASKHAVVGLTKCVSIVAQLSLSIQGIRAVQLTLLATADRTRTNSPAKVFESMLSVQGTSKLHS